MSGMKKQQSPKLIQFKFEKFQKIFKVQFKSTGFEKISKNFKVQLQLNKVEKRSKIVQSPVQVNWV